MNYLSRRIALFALVSSSMVISIQCMEQASVEEVNPFANTEKIATSGNLLATLGTDGKIRLWNTKTMKLLTTFEETYKPGEVNWLVFTRDGTALFIDTPKGSTSISLRSLL